TASSSVVVPPSSLGRIAPTGTTVNQYINGTAPKFSDYYASQGGVIQYNVSKGKIGSANPGVLFYYTGLSNTIKGVEGSVVDGKPDPITVFIDQNDNSPLVGPFTATNADVKLFKVNDLNHDGIIDSGDTSTQVQLKANQIQTNAGDVTVNFTPDAI